MGTNSNRRLSDFRPNENLDNLIKELSGLLSPVQNSLQKKYKSNKYPFLFLVGSPRSGTTLFLQWLASLNLFSYPTNVLNRFAYAPYIGAQIQKILFDRTFDYSGEFGDINSSISFSSNLGKTKGALATNEFQHFFRNYMDNFTPQYLNRKEIQNVDFVGIKQGLSSIEAVFDKPFAVKFMMLQFNLEIAFKTMQNSIFTYIKREPIFNMQSLLLARQKYYGDRNVWWSVKPKEINKLTRMDSYNQIAGQVYFTNKAIEESLMEMPAGNKVEILYEDFCQSPEKYYHIIREKYNLHDYELPVDYHGISSFQNANRFILSIEEIKRLENAYQYFKEKN